jgi:hypothetical protein
MEGFDMAKAKHMGMVMCARRSPQSKNVIPATNNRRDYVKVFLTCSLTAIAALQALPSIAQEMDDQEIQAQISKYDAECRNKNLPMQQTRDACDLEMKLLDLQRIKAETARTLAETKKTELQNKWMKSVLGK